MPERSPGPRYTQTVESTVLSNGYLVSTIALSEQLAPLDSLIATFAELVGDTERAKLGTPGGYETMVFAAENGEVTNWLELDFRRYATEEEARAGHEEIVETWLKKET